jgi:hypothetical protein
MQTQGDSCVSISNEIRVHVVINKVQIFGLALSFNATFNNISVISSVLLVEKTTDKLYPIMLYRVHLSCAGL